MRSQLPPVSSNITKTNSKSKAKPAKTPSSQWNHSESASETPSIQLSNKTNPYPNSTNQTVKLTNPTVNSPKTFTIESPKADKTATLKSLPTHSSTIHHTTTHPQAISINLQAWTTILQVSILAGPSCNRFMRNSPLKFNFLKNRIKLLTIKTAHTRFREKLHSLLRHSDPNRKLKPLHQTSKMCFSSQIPTLIRSQSPKSLLNHLTETKSLHLK